MRKAILFVSLLLAIAPLQAQHDIKTTCLSEIEKLSNNLNKEHTLIIHHIDSTIKRYNEARELISVKMISVSEQADDYARKTEKGETLVNEINILNHKKDSVNDAIAKFLIRSNNKSFYKIELQKRRCEVLHDQLNSAETELKRAEEIAAGERTNYQSYGGEQNYQNFVRSVDRYNSIRDNYKALIAKYNSEKDEYISLISTPEVKNNSFSPEVNDSIQSAKNINNELTFQICRRWTELDEIKKEYYNNKMLVEVDPEIVKLSLFIQDFRNNNYQDLTSKWIALEFSLVKSDSCKKLADNTLTIEGKAICEKTGPLFDTLGTMIQRFEKHYFHALSLMQEMSASVDGKEYHDLDLFSLCLSSEPFYMEAFETLTELFNIKESRSCEDFIRQVMSMDSLTVDPGLYPVFDLSFMKYLPSIKHLDISNNNFENFQPLFDIKYSGWVNISGSKRFTTKELKNICAMLNNMFGTECVYKK
ncbi:MAG TPA: hypothetical protein PKH02_08625 [Bacteroidales bacterium]|nr:hypothetical protein [Bacteroidales bacterium]